MLNGIMKWGELKFNPLPVQKNQYAVCKEGEGVAPEILASGDDDINKTIELLTGEQNFGELIKTASKWRNYLCRSNNALWSFQSFKTPEQYTDYFARWIDLRIWWCGVIKIGKDCSAVPEEIRKLQKTDPEEYVNQMVAYINSVAENDFEKVKMVFDIEQEILTYDHEAYQKDLELIAEAKKVVGEDYLLDATWGRSYLFMEPQFSVNCGHFPSEPEQQLLEKPMTLDEYKKLKNYKGNKD